MHYAVDIHASRPWLIHTVFYDSLLLKVFDFNVPEIFSLGAKGWVGGGGAATGLFYCECFKCYCGGRRTDISIKII